jgi:hypothetical protein
MKKIVLVLLIGLLVGTAAFADHDGFGIGLVLGGGGGLHGGGFYPGLSLKAPSIPIFWGIYASWYNKADWGHENYFGITVTGDYYIIDNNLVSTTATNEDGSYKFKLDWYFGLGGAVNLHFWNKRYWEWDRYWGHEKREDGFGLGLGLRVPIGLSWHVVTPFEIALGLAPTFGMYIAKNPGFWWDIHGELIFRLWVK